MSGGRARERAWCGLGGGQHGGVGGVACMHAEPGWGVGGLSHACAQCGHLVLCQGCVPPSRTPCQRTQQERTNARGGCRLLQPICPPSSLRASCPSPLHTLALPFAPMLVGRRCCRREQRLRAAQVRWQCTVIAQLRLVYVSRKRPPAYLPGCSSIATARQWRHSTRAHVRHVSRPPPTTMSAPTPTPSCVQPLQAQRRPPPPPLPLSMRTRCMHWSLRARACRTCEALLLPGGCWRSEACRLR